MFTTGVSSSNDEAVDLLFGSKTPGADNLLGGKEEPEVKTEEATNQEEVDNLLSGDPDPIEPADHIEPVVPNKETPKQVLPKKEVKPVVPSTMEVDYQAIYQNMVDEGVWEEVEVPEGTDWDKKLFLDVQKLQTTAKYEDLLSRTGDYGKAIIQYEQDGGNPSELISLFREQKEVKEYDISTPEGSEEFLNAFYSSQGSSEKSVERTIKSLRDQGGSVIQEEAEEKKAIWDNQYKEEIEERKREQALYAKQLQDAQRNFHSTMTSTISSDTQVTPKERKDLQSYMLDYSKSFRGQQVSQFYIDMAEVQKDPKNYVELAKFVKGLKTGEYTKKVEDRVKKEVSASSFLKIKNGATLKTSSGIPDLDKGEGSSFVTLLNRKK